VNYNASANIDYQEVEKFDVLASQWWDPKGPCEPLHVLNPCRLQYLKKFADLENKTILDVGCGAGILSESLASNKAKVTGLDASNDLIQAAREHATQNKLEINYQALTIENYILNYEQQYDIITCMELLEHVPDPAKLIQDCARLLKPGGQLFVSTLNRNLKAYALAIIGAEYLLNILEKQTHDYKMFIRPAELAAMLRASKMQLQDLAGIDYQPFTKNATLSADVSVNYICYAVKEV
jgi:2-polyprenyl-6-hydroxyphenyl methylase/3-demethylubiquinone-9 3-methyltransferase